jgi:glutathione S-transferase
LRLHYHPLSTTSRPVLLFPAQTDTAADLQVVDLLTGENFAPPFSALNPNQCVPVLEDDGFVLTDCSAILKHLAETTG